MHIDIHQCRIKRDPQYGHRIATTRQRIGIGRANGGQDLFVLDRAAIYERILRQRIRLVPRRQPDVTGKADLFASGVKRNCVGGKFITQHLGDSCQPVLAGRRKIQGRTIRAGKRKAHGREGDGYAPDDFGDRCGFRAIGFEEFQSRWCGKKQIADFNGGARVGRRRSERHRNAASQRDFIGVRHVLRAGSDGQPRDRAD